MKCPICNDVNLVMAERQGIEIDYCPNCRGVWLDRGELDKIIERSSTSPPRGEYAERDMRHGREDHRGHGKRKKRSSLLGELFDF